MAPALLSSPLGDELDVLRLGSLCTLGAVELDLRALGERLVALSDDRAVVDEQVLAAALGLDEAVALGVVEPLHGSSCHIKTPPHAMKERAEEAHLAQPILARVPPQCTHRRRAFVRVARFLDYPGLRHSVDESSIEGETDEQELANRHEARA